MNLKIIFISYLLICVLAFVFQRKLQFFPSKNLRDPAFYGLSDFQIQTLTTKDNLKITSWFKEPEEDQKTIVYFHGNGGNLADRNLRFKLFAKAGFGIMALSYQGYGTSEGKPSQKALIENADLVIDFLIKKGLKAEDMIFYGESLGSFVAIKQAVKFNPFAVVLESPFYSVLEIGKQNYWFLPVSLLLKDRFESNKYAGDVKSKVLVLHGDKDRVVPIKSGKKLFKIFTSEKKFVEVPGEGHITIADEILLEEIEKFVSQ